MLLLLLRFLWQNFGPSTPHSIGTATVATPMRTRPPRSGPRHPSIRPYIRRSCSKPSRSSTPAMGEYLLSSFSAPVIHNPVASARQQQVVNAGPPAATATPIDLRFYGYAAERSGHKRIFLLHGDDIFIAAEGDVVDRHIAWPRSDLFCPGRGYSYHDTQTLPLQQ